MTDIYIVAFIGIAGCLFSCYWWGRVDGLKEARKTLAEYRKEQP